MQLIMGCHLMGSWAERQEAISRWRAELVEKIGVRLMLRCRLQPSFSIKVRISWRPRRAGQRRRITKAPSGSRRSWSIPCKTGGTQAIMLTNNISRSGLVRGGRHPAPYTEGRSTDQGVAPPVIHRMPSEIPRAAAAIRTTGP